MKTNDQVKIAKELDALGEMSIGELRAKWADAFGAPTHSRNKQFLRKRIAWRIQANAFGGLTERALKRAEELANDADLRLRPPRAAPIPNSTETLTEPFTPTAPKALMPGSVLTRVYQGKRLVVGVLDKGFEYEGRIYGSLTALAKVITGSHWNGRHFFGLTQKEAA